MAKKINIQVNKRTILGKKVKSLRLQGQIPAVVYGGEGQSQPLLINDKAFKSLFKQVGETGLFYLEVEGEEAPRPVLMGEVQKHPLTLEPTHISFKQVSLMEKISADVPVVLVGEFGLPDAVVVVARDEVEVEALPTDIPEKFEIDVSKFDKIGQSVTFEDLKYDRNLVTLKIDQEQLSEPVVLVQQVKEEVVEEVKPEVVEAEVEAGTGQEKPTDAASAAKPAEGAKTEKEPAKK